MVPRQVWAAAQRNPIAKRSRKNQSGSEARPDGRCCADPGRGTVPVLPGLPHSGTKTSFPAVCGISRTRAGAQSPSSPAYLTVGQRHHSPPSAAYRGPGPGHSPRSAPAVSPPADHPVFAPSVIGRNGTNFFRFFDEERGIAEKTRAKLSEIHEFQLFVRKLV